MSAEGRVPDGAAPKPLPFLRDARHDARMNRRFALALPLALLAVAAAPPKRPARPVLPPAPLVLGDTVRVAITTELGVVTLDLDHKRAPLTTENFVKYADGKRFDGTVFYRVMSLDWGTPPNGLVQGGARGDPKRIMKPVAHEPTSLTGIRHKAGTISMARFAPGTATGDFSILVSDMPGLDADPQATDPESQAGYAAFGHVVEGMDVIKAIFAAPIDPNQGAGFLKGQMIAKPVKIITVRRVAIPVVAGQP